jgi:hypothetical protein
MSWVGFEPTVPASERAKRKHATVRLPWPATTVHIMPNSSIAVYLVMDCPLNGSDIFLWKALYNNLPLTLELIYRGNSWKNFQSLLSFKCFSWHGETPKNYITIFFCVQFPQVQILDTVAYRPIAKQWFCKQQLFLGNGSVNMFLLLGSRFLIMQQLDKTIKEFWFLCGPCQDVISKGQR